jgi:hypothetical protein
MPFPIIVKELMNGLVRMSCLHSDSSSLIAKQ